MDKECESDHKTFTLSTLISLYLHRVAFKTNYLNHKISGIKCMQETKAQSIVMVADNALMLCA